MRRRFLLVAVILLAQVGLVVGLSGVASAQTTLAGGPPTGCTQSGTASVHFFESIEPVAPEHFLKVKIVEDFTCTGISTVTPTVTQLTGDLKATLFLNAPSGPDYARQCNFFENPNNIGAPIDVVTSGSGLILWHAIGSNGHNLGAIDTTFTYGTSSTYDESNGLYGMEIGALSSNAGAGSFAGDIVTATVSIAQNAYNWCPTGGFSGIFTGPPGMSTVSL